MSKEQSSADLWCGCLCLILASAWCCARASAHRSSTSTVAFWDRNLICGGCCGELRHRHHMVSADTILRGWGRVHLLTHKNCKEIQLTNSLMVFCQLREYNFFFLQDKLFSLKSN